MVSLVVMHYMTYFEVSWKLWWWWSKFVIWLASQEVSFHAWVYSLLVDFVLERCLITRRVIPRVYKLSRPSTSKPWRILVSSLSLQLRGFIRTWEHITHVSKNDITNNIGVYLWHDWPLKSYLFQIRYMTDLSKVKST